MDRKLVSPNDLLRLLNDELKKHPDGGEDCRVHGSGLEHYRKPDKEGCNWTVAVVRQSGPSDADCPRAIREIEAKLRQEYNLK